MKENAIGTQVCDGKIMIIIVSFLILYIHKVMFSTTLLTTAKLYTT